jgi:hypothetical protein
LRRKWKDNGQLNVGVTLGGITGLIGLDVDEDGGEELLARLSGGDLPPTLEFTSGKGRRLLYKVPPGVQLRPTSNPGGEEVEGGELRLLGLGTQTVMPPSRHKDSGRCYAWKPGHGPGEIDPPIAPGWVIELMRDDGHKRNGNHSSGGADPLGAGEKIGKRKRNSTLTRMAGAMRRQGMIEEEIAEAILLVNAKRCNPPLDKDEVLGIARSIAGYPPFTGTANGSSTSPENTALVRTLADVTAQPVTWLWKPWIPLGAITLLDGDPGLGKSTISMDLAARVSRGWAMPPDGGPSCDPAGVLLLGAEDNLAYTIRPRLDGAGADVSRIHALEAIQTAEGERPPVLPWDLSLVEDMIADRAIRLVVVDPFMAFLDGDLDAHRDQDVRRCMHRLKLLAEKSNASILIVRHLNKLIGGPAIYRGGGSIGITGAVRSALVVGKNPNDQQQCVLAPVKCNLAAKPKSLLYVVETVGDVSRIGWLGETDLQADDVLAHSAGRKRKTTAEQCADAVRDFLTDGPRESEGMNSWLTQHGYSTWAIRAGRRLAGVKVQLVGYGAEGKWMAELPESDPDEEP